MSRAASLREGELPICKRAGVSTADGGHWPRNFRRPCPFLVRLRLSRLVSWEASMPRSAGIHHITAIAGEPKRHVAFYSRALGLRLVKRTVNFDDPGTWHLYFGDEIGSPPTR